jgi:5'-nucleotidase
VNVKSFAFGASLLAISTSASALNIALTNDDGWSTPGIQALYQALTEAGHTVILAGPLDGQSGSGTAFNFSSLEITRQAENQFSVALEGGEAGAEPATSGAVALNILAELTGAKPDLLVSGINSGANLAAATKTSGTVGAALHAVGLVTGGESVPAIAISTDERCDEDAGLTDECLAVADFLVDYIDHLIARPAYQKGNSKDLIPNGRALNINYPPVEPRGVKIARQGQLPLLGGTLRSIELGCSDCLNLEVGETTSGGVTGVRSYEGEKDVKNSDQEWFAEGFITVVVIQPDLGAKANGLKDYLRGFDY